MRVKILLIATDSDVTLNLNGPVPTGPRAGSPLVPSSSSEFAVANAYRLTYLDSYMHMGTSGRKMLSEGAFAAALEDAF